MLDRGVKFDERPMTLYTYKLNNQQPRIKFQVLCRQKNVTVQMNASFNLVQIVALGQLRI